ncbi:MAG: 2TM domain-containing protein [Chloroflexota bacterium]
MTDDFPKAPISAMSQDQQREIAIGRLKAKHDFRVHLVIFVIVNAALIALWYVTSTGADGSVAFFWPIFPLIGWGIGVVIHGYTTFFPPSLTEDAIQREMRRLR